MSGHTHEHALCANVRLERKPDSLAVLKGEIPVTTIAAYRTKALHHLGKYVELPGFRKGHVPVERLVAHVGEPRILEETAELVLDHGYGHLVEEHRLRPITRPAITLTKLALGNPIEFTIEVPIYPELTLPDYKVLAQQVVREHGDVDAQVVSDAEAQEEITRLRKMLGNADASTPEAELPAFDDGVVRSLGDFKDVADFTKQLKQRLLEEKKRSACEKRRIAIADTLVKATKGEIPAVMVDHELERMKYEFEHTLAQMGASWNDYTARQGKTDDEVRASWREDARKRVLLDLTLMEIARKESIFPDADAVEQQVRGIVARHPDVNEENVRTHIVASHTNDAVFAFLEAGAVPANVA